jgi:ribosome-binding protein aMBF1 (putative translation factor)
MKIERTTANEIGERLRATRENLGLDVQTISHELNLSVDIIEAIENGSIAIFSLVGLSFYNIAIAVSTKMRYT